MRRVVALCTLLCLMPAVPVRADHVIMDNGSILKGKVSQVTRDAVIVVTDFAEPIKVKRGRVSAITIDAAVPVHLENGDVITGTLTGGANGRVVMEQTEGRGAVTLEWSRVTAINPPRPTQWKGSVTAGGNIQSGNNDQAALNLGAEAVSRTEQHRFSAKVLYNIAQTDGTLSTRNAFGALGYDYFFTPVWYGQMNVSLFNDTFQDLNLRVIAGPGIGYQVWDEARKTLSLEAGISYLAEDYRQHPDKSWFTGRLSGSGTYHLTDVILISEQLVLYPSLENLNEFQLRNEASLTTVLGASWSLKLAHILDYVNTPPTGVKSTDSNLILGLQYGF